MTAQFYVHDDIDGRWHHIRAWNPDTDTWTLWCRPNHPHRFRNDAISTMPGDPACRDCHTALNVDTAARTELDAARAQIRAARAAGLTGLRR